MSHSVEQQRRRKDPFDLIAILFATGMFIGLVYSTGTLMLQSDTSTDNPALSFYIQLFGSGTAVGLIIVIFRELQRRGIVERQ